jgi:hypothetical protein
MHKFPKISEAPKNSRHQKGEMKQVPYTGPSNIRHHRTKFSRYGDLEPEIYAPLFYTINKNKNLNSRTLPKATAELPVATESRLSAQRPRNRSSITGKVKRSFPC